MATGSSESKNTLLLIIKTLLPITKVLQAVVWLHGLAGSVHLLLDIFSSTSPRKKKGQGKNGRGRQTTQTRDRPEEVVPWMVEEERSPCKKEGAELAQNNNPEVEEEQAAWESALETTSTELSGTGGKAMSPSPVMQPDSSI